MRTYQVPNDWQELDEEEESDNGQELMSSYGPLSVILYARVKKLKLFEPSDASSFLGQLADFYMRSLKELEKGEGGLQNIKGFINILPSPKRLRQLVNFRRLAGRDVVFFKFSLDMLASYYKITEGPLYTKLQREILPLAVELHRWLSPAALKDMAEELGRCMKKSKIFLLNYP